MHNNYYNTVLNLILRMENFGFGLNNACISGKGGTLRLVYASLAKIDQTN